MQVLNKPENYVNRKLPQSLILLPVPLFVFNGTGNINYNVVYAIIGSVARKKFGWRRQSPPYADFFFGVRFSSGNGFRKLR